ncbi:zinc finger SWIM domain-containing protein 7 [Penaeus vannamei]|uniref:zinc finger SWIM domain-containing protein 7 n=1 Tax=Penaeus vannamei TaxID=6689 RepID=UPI000F65EE8A|nr:zinc finger SWIM domain-containing protein 7-like [Penaeus vannamei]
MPKVPDTLAIMHGLLGVVKSEYESAGHLSSELLRSLHMLHGQTLVSALDLIDCKKVTIVTSSSGRWVYQVTGSAGTPYVCLPDSIFCQCPAFKFSVLKKKESVMCKHVLAALLATAMGVTDKKTISDEYMMDLLFQMD